MERLCGRLWLLVKTRVDSSWWQELEAGGIRNILPAATLEMHVKKTRVSENVTGVL